MCCYYSLFVTSWQTPCAVSQQSTCRPDRLWYIYYTVRCCTTYEYVFECYCLLLCCVVCCYNAVAAWSCCWLSSFAGWNFLFHVVDCICSSAEQTFNLAKIFCIHGTEVLGEKEYIFLKGAIFVISSCGTSLPNIRHEWNIILRHLSGP